MTDKLVLDIANQSIWITLQMAAPPLLAAVVAGLVVSVIQAATQINEQTLSFIPKVLLMTLAMAICGPWMMHTMMDFVSKLFTEIPNIIRPDL